MFRFVDEEERQGIFSYIKYFVYSPESADLTGDTLKLPVSESRKELRSIAELR